AAGARTRPAHRGGPSGQWILVGRHRRVETTGRRHLNRNRRRRSGAVLGGAGRRSGVDPKRRRSVLEYNVISADNHIIEAPHTFTAYLPNEYQDRAPRILRGED